MSAIDERCEKKRLLLEVTSGLYFAPSPGRLDYPHVDRARAWLYDEKQLLAAIRKHYGGDHGVSLVETFTPTASEYYSWMGRFTKGVTSPAKKKSSRANLLAHRYCKPKAIAEGVV